MKLNLRVVSDMNKKFAGLLSLVFIAASMLMAGCGDDNNNNNAGIVNGQCQAGYTWNGFSCVIGGNGTQCQAGYTWNGTSCVFTGQPGANNCPTGTFWNGSQCVAGNQGGVFCPGGSFYNGFQCVCPQGTIWNHFAQMCTFQQCNFYWNGRCL